MKTGIFHPLIAASVALCIFAGEAYGQAGQPESASEKPAAVTVPAPAPTEVPGTTPLSPAIPAGKVLVSFNTLPPTGTYELLGPISVFKRWFGGTGAAMKMLGERARELGANAVVETRVWLAPAFPANVAPHGKGIAIRVTDPKVLGTLVDEASSWE